MTESQKSSPQNEDAAREKQLNELGRISRPVEGFITRYIPHTTTVLDGERLKRVKLGEKSMSKLHKTILLVGETGMGKSTILNAMVSYMLGVKSEDRIWFEVTETKEDQTISQTKAVMVYDVFTELGPFSLTVIDTPGFGSTDKKKEDSYVAESLLELFRSEDGIHEIDTVCLVVTSLTSRLTERQHYVFNAVLSLFGNDIEKNIVVFVTHAAKKPNNTIKAIKKSGIPCAVTSEGELVYFRFDNSHCENFDDEDIADDYKASWKVLDSTMRSFQTFLKGINCISTKMTVAVLKNRKQLTASIFNIKDQIKMTELKQIELEQTKEALQQYEKEKKDQNDFQCEVDEAYKEKVAIGSKWWHLSKQATCCNVCEENCHYPGCWWVTDLFWCSVMVEGKCTVCTKKCPHTDHKKEGKIYKSKTRRVKKTMEDLKRKYETGSGEKKSLMSRLEEEISEIKKTKSRLVEECYECVILLEEIALKRDSVYTLQYLDFLIEKVKETGNTARVKKLEEMKKRADEQSAQATDWFLTEPPEI